jgi:hypothetical protein
MEARLAFAGGGKNSPYKKRCYQYSWKMMEGHASPRRACQSIVDEKPPSLIDLYSPCPMFPKRRIAMKIKNFLLVLIFALTPAMWAQDKPAQAPPGPGSGNQMRAEHRQKMMEMHKQEMEAVRADIEKMKASLAQMKANVLTIRDPNELSRWRDNVDMWETVVTHMDRMQKNMESMGPGMMHGHGIGGPPPTPPSEKKPE